MKVYVCNVFDKDGRIEETFVYSTMDLAKSFCEEYFSAYPTVGAFDLRDGKYTYFVNSCGSVEISEEIVDP